MTETTLEMDEALVSLLPTVAKTPASQHTDSQHAGNTGAIVAEMSKDASERQRRGRWFP